MTRARSSLLLYGSFAAVYLIWGSSFAVTKIMVAALPPFLAGGSRFLCAGLLLIAIARWRGQRVPRGPGEWRHIGAMALLHGVLSTGVNVIAMLHVASNQSALLNASGALWITLLGTVGVRRHPLTAPVAAGVALGFFGVGTLLWPHGGFTLSHFGWQVVVLWASFSWALGTHYFRSIRSATPTLMFLALQLLASGTIMCAIGLLLGEASRWHADPRGLLALGYLVIFNSAVAYTAYGYLMNHTTPARLSTYAYVNPAIAALVGWLTLGETMSSVQIAGTAVILAGVVLVSLPTRAPARADDQPAEPVA
jgi:drug/metabolite transporter (DMT)-like permease